MNLRSFSDVLYLYFIGVAVKALAFASMQGADGDLVTILAHILDNVPDLVHLGIFILFYITLKAILATLPSPTHIQILTFIDLTATLVRIASINLFKRFLVGIFLRLYFLTFPDARHDIYLVSLKIYITIHRLRRVVLPLLLLSAVSIIGALYVSQYIPTIGTTTLELLILLGIFILNLPNKRAW